MPSPLSAREFVTAVRGRVGDLSISGVNTTWTDLTILQVLDEVVQQYVVTSRAALRDHEVDREEFTLTSFTEVDENWHELRLPEYVAAVRYVEGLRGTGAAPIDLGPAEFETRNAARHALRGYPVWMWGRFGRPGTFALIGGISSLESIRIWFWRRYPQLHFGTLDQNGSATTVVFPASATGKIVPRDDTYNGLDVYNETTGELARINDYDGATRTATVDPIGGSWSATSGNTYSLMMPVEPELQEYLTQLAANQLYRRAGNMDYLAMTQAYTQELEESFRTGLRQRQTAAPKRLINRRGMR